MVLFIAPKSDTIGNDDRNAADDFTDTGELFQCHCFLPVCSVQDHYSAKVRIWGAANRSEFGFVSVPGLPELPDGYVITMPFLAAQQSPLKQSQGLRNGRPCPRRTSSITC